MALANEEVREEVKSTGDKKSEEEIVNKKGEEDGRMKIVNKKNDENGKKKKNVNTKNDDDRRKKNVNERRADENNDEANEKTTQSTVNTYTNVEGIKCFYTNADSLRNKMSELRTIVSNNKPQLIAITEVKAKNFRFDVKDVELQIPGYEIYKSDMSSNSDRGCILYIHKSLNPCYVQHKGTYKDAVWCEVGLINNDKLLVGCLYRSPNIQENDNLTFNKMINTTLEERTYSHLLMVGDFNLPDINWNTWTAPSDNIEDKNNIFLEILRDHYLYQHTDKPTRGRGTQKSNIIDLVLTNEEDMISDMEFWSPLGLSDHCMLVFKYNCYSLRSNSSQARYSYNRGDYERMRENLRINWTEKLESLKTVEGKWSFIKNAILNEIELHIPLRNQNNKAKKNPGVLNDKILRSIRKKHRAWQRYMETQEGEKYQEYCKARNKVKK